MPRNACRETNLHITWHTKHNAPGLVDQIENRTHHYLRLRMLQAPEVNVHETGGVADHVHIAVTIPPALLISDWTGSISPRVKSRAACDEWSV
ncbi:MAG: hypothetical protein DCC65_13155 [Planctomycetota bacterium]|nr:MAG: hypothetical protein DCC65_13155 [Planctomycetota bacterium]